MPDSTVKLTGFRKVLASLVTLAALFGIFSLFYFLLSRPCQTRKPKCGSNQEINDDGVCGDRCTNNSNCKISEVCTSGVCTDAKVCHNVRCANDEGCPYQLRCVNGVCTE